MKNALLVSGLIALSLVACGKTQDELAADAERPDTPKIAAAKIAPVVTPAKASANDPAAAPTSGAADKAKE